MAGIAALTPQAAHCYTLKRSFGSKKGQEERMRGNRLNDRAAIVGIGQLPFSKDIGRPIGDTAVEVVLRALEDAGLQPADVDGTVKFQMEDTQECAIARRAGVENLRFFCEVKYGGGPNCAVVGHAAAAITLGLASAVVCW